MSSDGHIHSTDFFINRSDDSHLDDRSLRYWEPHTSSIDFCETNYLLSGHVVEFHNALSSLWGLTLPGVLGILYGNPLGERRTTVAYAVLIVIGIGSAALHATLHWSFQGADELPMIYLLVSAAYGCLEVDAPRGRPNYPRLPFYLMALCCINTVIYFCYREIYIVFLGTFVAMLLVLVSVHVRIALKMRKKMMDVRSVPSSDGGSDEDEEKRSRASSRRNAELALGFYMWHYVAFAAVAVPIWLLDQFRCEELLPVYDMLPFPLRGTTLHVAWHACSGLGAHLFVQFVGICRADGLGLTCEMRRVMGMFPVAELQKEKKGETRKKKSV